MSKLYTNIQQDQKAKLDYHMSMLFAYMAGWEGCGLEVLKCFVRGGQNFFYFVCVCGVGGVRSSTSPSVKKKPDPHLLLIYDWSIKQKNPKGHYVAYLF